MTLRRSPNALFTWTSYSPYPSFKVQFSSHILHKAFFFFLYLSFIGDNPTWTPVVYLSLGTQYLVALITFYVDLTFQIITWGLKVMVSYYSVPSAMGHCQ